MSPATALNRTVTAVRVAIERTFLTTPEGRRLLSPETQRFVVIAPSLRNAILEFITREDGRVLGTITEVDERAVCTGWTGGRLYIMVVEPAAD